MSERLLKVSEVAEILNCSESFVYQLLVSELRYFRLGKGQGGIRVGEQTHLAPYLAQHEQGGVTVDEAKTPGPPTLRHISLD